MLLQTRELPPSARFPSPSGKPRFPQWRFPFGKPPPSAAVKEKKLERRGRPNRGVSLAYAAFGGDRKIKKKNWGAFGGPFRARLRRPKWF